MAIYRLFRNSAFGRDEIQLMSSAFDRVRCGRLSLKIVATQSRRRLLGK